MSQNFPTYNWSRYPVVDAQVHTFQTEGDLREMVKKVPKLIARGAGLSYGDASLASHIVSTKKFNKLLNLDVQQGVIRCESGVTLDEILKIAVPKGWFLPVTPGTKFITIGGAVAADVHGKNHHIEGSFNRYVNELTLMQADGSVLTCAPGENADLFHATCGGMGLSGVILEIELRLRRIETAYIVQENLIARNLGELLDLLMTYNDRTYSVAWVDCLTTGKSMGRGVLMLGEHAEYKDLPAKLKKAPLAIHSDPRLKIPFDLPSFVLNKFSIGLFNQLFNLKHRLTTRKFTVHYDTFFYPLDFIQNWNRMYGRRGFLQYQFVIPFEKGEETLAKILHLISQSKLASFLTVLKLLGASDHSVAFPMPGFTLALDLPVSARLFPLLDQLDEIVAENGGRIYLAKDARMKAEIFKKGYPGAADFNNLLKHSGAVLKFESSLSKRLF